METVIGDDAVEGYFLGISHSRENWTRKCRRWPRWCTSALVKLMRRNSRSGGIDLYKSKLFNFRIKGSQVYSATTILSTQLRDTTFRREFSTFFQHSF